MTTLNAGVDVKPLLIEMGSKEIVVSYQDGSVVVDDDVAFEKRGQSADIFIKPQASEPDSQVIISHNRFRADAERWGPVREKLAEMEEQIEAQQRLKFATETAQSRLNEFQTALSQGKVTMRKTDSRDKYELFYTDPQTGTELIFHLSPAPSARGKPLTVGTLSLDEGNIRISITDTALLKPLRARLDPLLQRQTRANSPSTR